MFSGYGERLSSQQCMARVDWRGDAQKELQTLWPELSADVLRSFLKAWLADEGRPRLCSFCSPFNCTATHARYLGVERTLRRRNAPGFVVKKRKNKRGSVTPFKPSTSIGRLHSFLQVASHCWQSCRAVPVLLRLASRNCQSVLRTSRFYLVVAVLRLCVLQSCRSCQSVLCVLKFVFRSWGF